MFGGNQVNISPHCGRRGKQSRYQTFPAIYPRRAGAASASSRDAMPMLESEPVAARDIDSKEGTMTRLILATLTAGALMAMPAQAQDAGATAPDSRDGRYSVYRVNDTLVRLDSRTGQVSVCSQGAAGWACRAVPDDRIALESEISRMQNENAALKKELLARNLPLPEGVRPPSVTQAQPAQPSPPGNVPNVTPETRLPTEAEFDRAMAFLGKAWRRMVEMIAELQRDIERRKNADPKN